MSKAKYFDTHFHAFPDKIVGKAMGRLIEVSKLRAYTDGSYADALKKQAEWGCCGGVILHIATNPKQQCSVNNFAAECQQGNVLCFGSVHPESTEIKQEIGRIYNLGLKGIKLHPDYQEFFVNDPIAFPIYEEASRLGLPIAFHTGYDPLSPKTIHCSPEKLADVAERFPQLKIIAAHMGGSNMTDKSIKYLAGRPNVWIDTAIMDAFVDAALFADMVAAFGDEKIFFATDLPWSCFPLITEIIEDSGISESAKANIYYRNAEDFFAIRL